MNKVSETNSSRLGGISNKFCAANGDLRSSAVLHTAQWQLGTACRLLRLFGLLDFSRSELEFLPKRR
jgi:hypothetical protein